jgi:hypothetical protein
MYSNQEIIKAVNLINNLLSRQWCRLTFHDFCKATGMVDVPGDDYAMNKWNHFQRVVENWGAFDVGTLTKILAYDPENTEPEPDPESDDYSVKAKAILLGDKILLDRADGIEKVFQVTGPDTFKQIDSYCDSLGVEITNKDSFLWWSDREKYYAGLDYIEELGEDSDRKEKGHWNIYRVSGPEANNLYIHSYQGTATQLRNHLYETYMEQFDTSVQLDHRGHPSDRAIIVHAAGVEHPVDYIKAVRTGV